MTEDFCPYCEKHWTECECTYPPTKQETKDNNEKPSSTHSH